MRLQKTNKQQQQNKFMLESVETLASEVNITKNLFLFDNHASSL